MPCYLSINSSSKEYMYILAYTCMYGFLHVNNSLDTTTCTDSNLMSNN